MRAPPKAAAPGRQLAYFWRRHILRNRHMVAAGLPYGMRIRFSAPDDVGRRIYKRGVHEPHILAWLEGRVPGTRPALVLDVGANLGWYSVLLDRLNRGNAVIHAFEPDPFNARLLAENLALNGVARAEVHEWALSDRAGTGRLRRYRDINLGRHRLGAQPSERGSVDVPLQALDAFLQERGLAGQPVQLLKIDVEGHEPEVVRGARRALADTRLVVLEFSPGYYRPGFAAEMIGIIEGSGLRPQLYESGSWRRTSRAELLGLDRQVDTVWDRR